MGKFKQWLLKVICKSIAKADKNQDGILEIVIKYDMEDKHVDWEIK